MSNQAGVHFYDIVSNRMAAYTPKQTAELAPRVEGPNPENRFTELVKQLVLGEHVVLDIGTGDGSWLRREVAPLVRSAIGLDDGAVRLSAAVGAGARHDEAACDFMMADAASIPMPEGAVDVLINRRGPLTANDQFFAEGCRVLKPGGLVLSIDIGEENAREVDEAFGRGQMLADRSLGPRLPRLQAMFERYGVMPEVAEDLLTFEHYSSREAIELKLLTTPIVEDYDPDTDSGFIDLLIRQQPDASDIQLTFHRLVLLGRKSS